MSAAPVVVPRQARMERWLPGLFSLLRYDPAWLGNDLLAGVSIAAVQIPVAIAYAELAGFPPEVGLYASILPLVGYALFASSRRLVVGPDSATCAIVAATLAPLAAPASERYATLAVGLTLLTGLFCILAGALRLGAIASFLSRPILVGFLNGVALQIMVGQLGKLAGFQLQSRGIVRPALEFLERRRESHEATLVLGLALLALLIGLKHLAPRWPGPLIAVVAGGLLAFALDLQAQGVALVGRFASGFPQPRLPLLTPDEWHELLPGALGIAVVSFCSGMLTARSFAARHGEDVDANQEFVAFGAADVFSAVSQGFAVTGADSRTAVNDAMGGRSQLAGVIAAVATALVLVFAAAPFALVPRAALAAVLILAGYSLLDLGAWTRLWRVSRPELWLSVVTTFGVVSEGVLKGILVAVGLAVLRLLILGTKPGDAVLGQVPGLDGYHSVSAFPNARTVPGLVIYRFDAALLFFNADYFKRRVLEVVAAEPAAPRCFLLSAEAINYMDVTGADTLRDLHAQLAAKGITLFLARPRQAFLELCERTGLADLIGRERIFPTTRTAVERYRAELLGPAERPQDDEAGKGE